MAHLALARLVVAALPFKWWRRSLGWPSPETGDVEAARTAHRLASQIDRAAQRLPFATKCLPRAMALSWLLRRRRLGHCLVIAVRPPELREGDHGLHAWVEVEGDKVIGDLPGPWLETLRMGAVVRR